MNEPDEEMSVWEAIVSLLVVSPASFALSMWGVTLYAGWIGLPPITPWQAALVVLGLAWLAPAQVSEKARKSAVKSPAVFGAVVAAIRACVLGGVATVVWFVEN